MPRTSKLQQIQKRYGKALEKLKEAVAMIEQETEIREIIRDCIFHRFVVTLKFASRVNNAFLHEKAEFVSLRSRKAILWLWEQGVFKQGEKELWRDMNTLKILRERIEKEDFLEESLKNIINDYLPELDKFHQSFEKKING